MGAKIVGAGAYLPKNVVKNEYFEGIRNEYDKTMEAFYRGSVERRHASKDETALYMATLAGKNALENSNVNPEEIDFVLGNIEITELHTPKPEYLLMRELGLKNADCLDINVVCSSFLAMLNLAHTLILSGKYKKILIVCSMNYVNTALDKTKNYSGVGDGAGAIIVEHANHDSLIGSYKEIDTSCYDFVGLKNAQITGKKEYVEFSNDDEVKFKSMEIVPPVAKKLLNRENINVDEIDWLIMHQPGARAMDYWRNEIGISEEKLLHTFYMTANVFAANMPIILNHYINNEKKIKRGDKILFLSAGAGAHTIATVWRY